MDYKVITTNTYNDIANDYSDRDSLVIPETIDVKKALDRFISLTKPGSKVLDVGCAGGRDAKHLSEGGLNVVGIDISEKMIENAKKRVPGVEYLQMDFESISFPEESFDAVWANASLHHVPKENLPKVLKDIFGILKKDGILFIKIKHGTFDGIQIAERFGKEISRHFSYYLPDELTKIVEQAGFTVLDKYLSTSDEWLDVIAKK